MQAGVLRDNAKTGTAPVIFNLLFKYPPDCAKIENVLKQSGSISIL
jgi:hypothetical protein